VVVSQDGEMREFVRLPDGRVGVCGPLAPMSVSAPAAWCPLWRFLKRRKTAMLAFR